MVRDGHTEIEGPVAPAFLGGNINVSWFAAGVVRDKLSTRRLMELMRLSKASLCDGLQA